MATCLDRLRRSSMRSRPLLPVASPPATAPGRPPHARRAKLCAPCIPFPNVFALDRRKAAPAYSCCVLRGATVTHAANGEGARSSLMEYQLLSCDDHIDMPY